MITLYHAPLTRSSRILSLLDELGAQNDVTIETVSIRHSDGSGQPDPKNPHPDGKVPYLEHDGVGIRESTAIAQYLCTLYPDAGMAPNPGDPAYGAYLAWISWYGNVLEPVLILHAIASDDPRFAKPFGSLKQINAHLHTTLRDQPYLLGETYSVADLIISSAYLWLPTMVPDIPEIRDWVTRCGDRPAVRRITERETKAMNAA